MSTNTNASSGASQRPLKKEIGVKRVDDSEIIKDIKNYTGRDDMLLTADCIIYDVGERNRNENGNPAGSNVNAVATGKQTTEELENGNSVTLVARDAATLNRSTSKKTTDGKKEKDDNAAEDKTAGEK